MEGGDVPVGEIDIPDIEQPSFQNLSAGFETAASGLNAFAGGLNTIRSELERFENVQPSQQGQQIQEIKDFLQLILQAINRNHLDLSSRITATENSNTQLRNRLNHLSNSSATLLPLRHPQTGNFIENCPSTIAQINRLSGIEATRILEILGVQVPPTLPQKREAVRLQFI
ncbi:hypothetical protein VF21_01637 [Pseudogymnoascus sp. 05NY08]|nr:hypothetical protein VF21_01637 [Pseudogymnoascus sp. 05NY08]